MKSFTEPQAETFRRAAQELKNNHDFVLTTNQWLQKLDEAMVKIQKDLTTHTAEVGSKLKAQDICIENLSDDTKRHKKSTSHDLDEYRGQISFCMGFMKESVDKSQEHFSSLEDCAKSISVLKERLDSMISEINRIDQLVCSEFIRIRKEIDSSNDSVKKEIMSLPSEVPGIKQFISERISVFEVNFQGLIREIEVIKKNAFISSKYIEDLYDKFKKASQ